MKRKLPLVFGALFLAFAAGACEGPQGPAGPEGPRGEQGPPGDPGQDGENALNTCSDCHSSDATIVAVEQQFETSAHADAYLRASGSCIDCHTSQGFVANVTGGTADFSGGAAILNCRTCHQIHSEYTDVDYALTTTDPVTLLATGNELDAGNGNLCASCHQARTEDAYPQWDAAVSSEFELGEHYGFHHGPQANMTQAEFPTEVLYGFDQGTTFGSHEAATCTDCHMGIGDAVADFDLPTPTPGGELGHNFAPAEDVCNSCHTNDVTDEGFDHNGVRTDVGTVIDGLVACLEAEGVVAVDPTTGEWHGITDDENTTGVNEGLHPEPYVAAYLVTLTVFEDGSFAAHNPSFVKAWVDAAATEMDANSTNAACDYTSPF